MNFQLTQEQEMLVDAVRSFVAKELLPHEEAVDRADEVSPSSPRRFAARPSPRLLRLQHARRGRWRRPDYLSQALIERELSKVSWALHVFVARPSKILMACTGEQINDYLLPCIQGEKIDCFALTEPGAGSDANAIKTRACATATTSSSMAASTSSATPATPISPSSSPSPTPTSTTASKRNAVTSFLVDRNTPGMTIRRGPNA
jgi:alkylation response protein AidB-like acyl-CoA dehydrogenase